MHIYVKHKQQTTGKGTGKKKTLFVFSEMLLWAEGLLALALQFVRKVR